MFIRFRLLLDHAQAPVSEGGWLSDHNLRVRMLFDGDGRMVFKATFYELTAWPRFHRDQLDLIGL
jgi:hypothetical protein